MTIYYSTYVCGLSTLQHVYVCDLSILQHAYVCISSTFILHTPSKTRVYGTSTYSLHTLVASVTSTNHCPTHCTIINHKKYTPSNNLCMFHMHTPSHNHRYPSTTTTSEHNHSTNQPTSTRFNHHNNHTKNSSSIHHTMRKSKHQDNM
jgi:hypothetical protein